MENTTLHHWGIRGMRWGVRRYQNKDGSLTKAGRKRYNSEMDKLKEKERVLKNKERTKAKIEKLESKRKEIEEREKNLRTKSTAKEKPVDTQETIEQKKQRILDSHSAKEIYKNKDLFTDQEISIAYQRLNNERNIKSLIPEDVNPGKKFVDGYVNTGKTVKNVVDTSSDLYNSFIKGKELLDKLYKTSEAT